MAIWRRAADALSGAAPACQGKACVLSSLKHLSALAVADVIAFSLHIAERQGCRGASQIWLYIYIYNIVLAVLVLRTGGMHGTREPRSMRSPRQRLSDIHVHTGYIYMRRHIALNWGTHRAAYFLYRCGIDLRLSLLFLLLLSFLSQCCQCVLTRLYFC